MKKSVMDKKGDCGGTPKVGKKGDPKPTGNRPRNQRNNK